MYRIVDSFADGQNGLGWVVVEGDCSQSSERMRPLQEVPESSFGLCAGR